MFLNSILSKLILFLLFTADNSNNRVHGNEKLPDEQMLISKLLSNYDPAARPVFNSSKTVVIRFNIALIQIIDMDEKNQILTTNVWLEQEWIDERLKWNKSEYNNLNKIRLPSDRVWLPDIVLYNTAEDISTYMKSKAMIEFNGNIFWPPLAKLKSSCKIDVTYFPFDDQVCSLKFGSWTYSGTQVDLINRSTSVDLSNYVESGEWNLKSITLQRNIKHYPCCPDESFPDITFDLALRRKTTFYLINIILPMIWLSFLSLLVFCIPPESGDKISLGITILLSFSMFLLLIAENIPETSESIPLIGIYLAVLISFTSTSVILTVLVLRMHFGGSFVPHMSPKFYQFMTVYVASLVGLTSAVKLYETNKRLHPTSSVLVYESPNHQSYNKELAYKYKNHKYSTHRSTINESFSSSASSKLKLNNLKNEWKLIALICDRFFFWLYFVLTLGFSLIILVILPNLKYISWLDY